MFAHMNKQISRCFAATPIFITTSIVSLLISSCKKDISSTITPDTVQTSAAVASPLITSGLGDGVNLQPSYYNGGNPNFGWSLMKQQTRIKTVRIEIEPTSVTQAKSWISQAKSNGFAIIATYHKASVLGSDNTAELTAAANWWKTNYSVLGGGFTINLMNEWGSHTITASAYASAYNSAISIVRKVYGGPIIIDIPGWGQETLTAYNACKTSSPKITDGNIILSTHIYPGDWNQGRNHTFQKSDLDDMSNTGRPCIVGEFGTGSGSADWSGCVDYAKSKGWTVLAWSWNGDGGSLNMVTPSWASNGGATSFSLSSYFSVVYPKL
jgi:mannan endo-1,4-beta-mannosidase